MPASREQLIGLVDKFLDAAGHNDPSRLPMAADVRYTENCQPLALGKGLWATATPHAPAQHYLEAADAESDQVAYLGVLHEDGKPSIFCVRLKAEGSRVREIEVLIARRPEESGQPRVFNPENMVQPKPIFSEVVPPDQRTPRADLLRIPHLYLDGILAADGDAIPVLDECLRVENGVQTVLNPQRGTETGKLGVREQVNSGVFRDIEAARDRRVLIADEERGLVFAIFLFDHPGPVTGSGFKSRYSQPNSMMVAEVFKVAGGVIQQIEAVLNVFAYGTRSGW